MWVCMTSVIDDPTPKHLFTGSFLLSYVPRCINIWPDTITKSHSQAFTRLLIGPCLHFPVFKLYL